MKLVILASGRGSRLNKLTLKTPKCLVKVNGKTILSYLRSSFGFFDKTIIITGYLSNLISKELNNEVLYVKNIDYLKTNMVHSLFCASHLVDDDIIVSYSDIIFNKSIFKRLIKCKNSTVPLNYSWLDSWKKRMSKKDIFNDAEDVTVENNKLISIGGKLTNKSLPKMQFMGLMKINKKDYFKMKKKYHDLKNPNIDFTSFIDFILKSKTIDIEYLKTNVFWTEIDTYKDLKVAEKNLKRKK